MFVVPDGGVLRSLQAVSQWATTNRYDAAAVNTLLQVADYYRVAQAHARGLTVVTHEIPGNSVKRIKIPDACIALGIKCMAPYEMLRVERARFVLGRAPELGAD